MREYQRPRVPGGRTRFSNDDNISADRAAEAFVPLSQRRSQERKPIPIPFLDILIAAVAGLLILMAVWFFFWH
jgi:hypothetical protein